MVPGGLVQLTEAPPQGLQFGFVQGPPRPPMMYPLATPPLQPISTAGHPAVSVPVNLCGPTQPCPLPPTIVPQPIRNPGSALLLPRPPQPRPQFLLPYKGVVQVDPAAPPSLRREVLQFDPALMFLEPPAAVCDWLSGRGGVVVPGVGVALPYLPPFVSSLNTLSALLRSKKSLISSSSQLLSQGSAPPPPSTTPGPTPTPDLPDSTSDVRPGDQPGNAHLSIYDQHTPVY